MCMKYTIVLQNRSEKYNGRSTSLIDDAIMNTPPPLKIKYKGSELQYNI